MSVHSASDLTALPALKPERSRSPSPHATREFWHLKGELMDLIYPELNELLEKVYTGEELVQIQGEVCTCLSYESAVLGVFPVGGTWGEQKMVDLRFKPGLLGLRFHQVIKH